MSVIAEEYILKLRERAKEWAWRAKTETRDSNASRAPGLPRYLGTSVTGSGLAVGSAEST